MNPSIVMAIINLLIPEIASWFRAAHGTDPKYASFTDEDMFQEVVSNISKYVTEIDLWQRTHPRV